MTHLPTGGVTAEGIEGWMSPPELDWLRSQARGTELTVEVGVWCGRSTHAIAEVHYQHGGFGIAVDHFGGAREITKAHRLQRGAEGVRAKAIRNLSPFINSGCLRLMETESTVAYQHLFQVFGPNSIDFVFIDGGHNYGPALLDVTLYYNLVREGGVFAGHDYDLEGVRRAVRDAVGEVNEGPGSIWHLTKHVA